mmetsp:Transcript_24226/g.36089  ORF Transcript_24226/g.36089 Transcript_24226/m.36089 type:complete len:259 (-) Transcript_24226:67-843(-)
MKIFTTSTSVTFLLTALVKDAVSFTVSSSLAGVSTGETFKAFSPSARSNYERRGEAVSLNLFGDMFEEAGPLGKGITVGKVQVALNSFDRSSSSIIGMLETKTEDVGDSPEELSRLTNDICLALLRKNDDWISACSESKHFKTDDAGKAESLFNEWANLEAAKFEKEYIPGEGKAEKGGPTIVVVSLVVEIQGDETNFEGAGYSTSKTRDVLASIAADCLVDEGYCLNAAEVFWTPGEPNEILTKTDVIVDFPALIDL